MTDEYLKALTAIKQEVSSVKDELESATFHSENKQQKTLDDIRFTLDRIYSEINNDLSAARTRGDISFIVHAASQAVIILLVICILLSLILWRVW